MVGLGGLEPPASPLSGVRSNQLSYRPGEPPAAVRASLLRKLGGYPNVTRPPWDLLAPQNARSWRSAHVRKHLAVGQRSALKET